MTLSELRESIQHGGLGGVTVPELVAREIPELADYLLPCDCDYDLNALNEYSLRQKLVTSLRAFIKDKARYKRIKTIFEKMEILINIHDC